MNCVKLKLKCPCDQIYRIVLDLDHNFITINNAKFNLTISEIEFFQDPFLTQIEGEEEIWAIIMDREIICKC